MKLAIKFINRMDKENIAALTLDERPEKGCEVFIGKIPRDCFEDELVPVLSSVGNIFELRLMMDFR